MSSNVFLSVPSRSPRTLRNDIVGLGIVLVAMLLGGLLAYRVPVHHWLGIGDGPNAGYDGPYLEGFNIDPETTGAGHVGFRWAFDQAAIRLPALGRSTYLFTLQLAAGRPQPATSRWRLADQPLVNVQVGQTPRRLHLLLPPRDDDLRLRMTTPPFQAGNDRRALAFAVDWIKADSLGPPGPALGELAGCLLMIGLLYGLLRWWHLPLVLTVLLLVGLAAGLSALLVWHRLVLTLTTARWVLLLLAAYPLFWAVRWLLKQLARRLVPHALTEAHPVAALVVLAWLLRVLALVHPQAITSDAGLHVHILENLVLGKVIFTEGLPTRAGGGDAPYPPGGYISLLPALLLVPPDLLVTVGSALFDSMVIGGLWLLCSLAELPSSVALFAGAMYIFAAPALLSLAVGEMANILAQALTMPFTVALLAWHKHRISSAALIGWASVALLGHFGVFLSLLAFGGLYSLLLVLDHQPSATKLILLFALATVLAVLVYYLVWTSIILQRVPHATGELPSGLVRPTLSLSLQLIWQQLRGLGDLRDVGLIPFATELGGLVILWRRARSLAHLETAWWLAGALVTGPAPVELTGFALAALVIRSRRTV